MNRKGFTLIELLAVIVILGIILVITGPKISETYKNSRLKTEEIFIDRLSDSIETYVNLYGDTLEFNYYRSGTKILKGETSEVNIYSTTKIIEDVINKKIISEEDFVNPGNKSADCATNTSISIYKDSDYVYCYKLEVLNCISDEYKANLTSEYIIDTCEWKENQ